jgi:ankyrin repeat protein
MLCTISSFGSAEGALIKRICNGRTDLVYDLLAAGHSARTTDVYGVPLMKWCAYYGDVSAIRCLLEQGEALTSLGDNLDLNGAAFHGHWQLCEFLLERGADVNHRHPSAGETPLHVALSRANRAAQERVVAVLLSAGADPNVAALPGAETGCFMRDCRSKAETPLHRAAAFASEVTIRALLSSGARPDTKDMHGDTPLTWASWHLRPASILRMLCYDGFTINPDADWGGDHGLGLSGMDASLLGEPATTIETSA